jgi:GNAT superfamily N-acetyltransferase
VDGELPELRALATYFRDAGGALWAAERDGRVIGMAATRPMRQDEAWEICKVYVGKAARGSGLAHALLDAAEGHARAAGAARLVLWTDTRFEAAHRFYEKRGYVRQGSIRILDDISNSLEFRYAKPLRGLVVEALDAAAAASAGTPPRRAAGGLRRRWREPHLPAALSPAAALAFWKRVSSDVALGKGRPAGRLARWRGGGHRASHARRAGECAAPGEVAKLMVSPAARRSGVGRALMRRVEQTARGIGRRILVLDTRVGTAAHALYRAAGWTEACVIPGFELGPDRQPVDVVFFWKALS